MCKLTFIYSSRVAEIHSHSLRKRFARPATRDLDLNQSATLRLFVLTTLRTPSRRKRAIWGRRLTQGPGWPCSVFDLGDSQRQIMIHRGSSYEILSQSADRNPSSCGNLAETMVQAVAGMD